MKLQLGKILALVGILAVLVECGGLYSDPVCNSDIDCLTGFVCRDFTCVRFSSQTSSSSSSGG